MSEIPLDAVQELRRRLDQARQVAASRFRDSFDARGEQPPNERWHVHLEIQANCLLESAREVRLRHGYRVAFHFAEPRLVQPIAVRSGLAGIDPSVAVLPPERSFFPFFEIDRTATALLEFWMITSEIAASPAWAVTKLIASAAEYRDAIERMQTPQIIRALNARFLPEASWEDDDTARLDVTLWSRAGSERIERRDLLLDRSQELRVHDRELLVEGRGGIAVD